MKRKLDFILIVNNLAFIAGIFLSYPLWQTNRSFPVVPIFEHFPQLPEFLSQLPVIVLIIVLLAQLVLKKRILFIISLVIVSYLLAQDLMRWQPWVYLHFLFLIPFCFNLKKQEKALAYYQVILFGVYFWSGFYKLNTGFTNTIFVDSIRQIFNINLTKYSNLGYLIAITEILTAIGLLFKPTRKLASFIAIFTHFIILLWLSPFGGNSNSVIIPWNLMMIALIYFCFISDKDQISFSSIKFKNQLHLIALTAIILPAFYSLGYWPYYFSFQLYSGQGKSFYISLADEDFFNQDEYFNNSCYNSAYINELNNIKLSTWSYRALNVPTPSDERIYTKIAEEICKQSTSAEFHISDKIIYTKNSKTFSCKNR